MHHHASYTLRAPRVYLPVALLTAGFIVWAAIGDPTDFGAVEFTILLASVLLLGIPHGAIDHLVASDVYQLDASLKDQATFYAAYMAVMALYATLWVLFPAVSLILFLLFAVYHFGQSDLAHIDASRELSYLLWVSRGLVLIGLPVFAHLAVVAPIFEMIAGIDMAAVPGLAANADLVVLAIIIQHVALLMGVLHYSKHGPLTFARELLTVSLLIALFLLAHPLVAFAVYFALWHSLGHVLELVQHFDETEERFTVLAFYKKALPFTAISLGGLALLYGINILFGLEEHLISLLFILIAVLTLPHMIVVERFYQTKKVSLQRAD